MAEDFMHWEVVGCTCVMRYLRVKARMHSHWVAGDSTRPIQCKLIELLDFLWPEIQYTLNGRPYLHNSIFPVIDQLTVACYSGFNFLLNVCTHTNNHINK